ncbi:MAG: aspartate dehydrogenase [Lachnospiraceae bacterium]|nr:aspartate dehydrogenase [Lachnospiraceae bacterium]
MSIFKKHIEKQHYDKENQKPILRSSICTGEQVAGFKNVHTGKVEEIMCIRSAGDLEQFMEMYGISVISKEY